jgi:hypothetical protein
MSVQFSSEDKTAHPSLQILAFGAVDIAVFPIQFHRLLVCKYPIASFFRGSLGLNL